MSDFGAVETILGAARDRGVSAGIHMSYDEASDQYERWRDAGSSHSIVNYIPHENSAAMINAIHKYGAY